MLLRRVLRSNFSVFTGRFYIRFCVFEGDALFDITFVGFFLGQGLFFAVLGVDSFEFDVVFIFAGVDVSFGRDCWELFVIWFDVVDVVFNYNMI